MDATSFLTVGFFPAYSGALLLKVVSEIFFLRIGVHFYHGNCNWSLFTYNWSFSAYSGIMLLTSTLMDPKQREAQRWAQKLQLKVRSPSLYACNVCKEIRDLKINPNLFVQNVSRTLWVMDVRAENRGCPQQKARFPVAPVMGRNFWTPGHQGVRVRNVRGKSGPKNVCLCCFFSPERFGISEN